MPLTYLMQSLRLAGNVTSALITLKLASFLRVSFEDVVEFYSRFWPPIEIRRIVYSVKLNELWQMFVQAQQSYQLICKNYQRIGSMENRQPIIHSYFEMEAPHGCSKASVVRATTTTLQYEEER